MERGEGFHSPHFNLGESPPTYLQPSREEGNSDARCHEKVLTLLEAWPDIHLR